MIKGVIFDLDDTIVNSEPLHVEACALLLREYGSTVNDIPSQMRQNHMGMRTCDILKQIVAYLKINEDINILYEKRVSFFMQLVENKLTKKSGLLSALALLKNNNYSLAIASSGTKKYINFVLNKFNIGNYFQVVVTGDDVMKGQPDPETYTIAVLKLGLKPSECIVFEDAVKGVDSAKKAGCLCVAINTPYTSTKDLFKADFLIDSLNDITLELINKASLIVGP